MDRRVPQQGNDEDGNSDSDADAKDERYLERNARDDREAQQSCTNIKYVCLFFFDGNLRARVHQRLPRMWPQTGEGDVMSDFR